MPDALPAAKFSILSDFALKAYDAGNGKRRVKAIASSTIKDRVGDSFSKKALEQMAASAKGMTVFLNHKYLVPEDVFGLVEEASVVPAKDTPDVWDLDLDIEPDEENPRSARTLSGIERGIRYGISVGALVKNAWKEKDGSVTIDDVTLLEASVVGIPANPRSWVEYAVKALTEAPEEDADFVDGTAFGDSRRYYDMSGAKTQPKGDKKAEPDEPEGDGLDDPDQAIEKSAEDQVDEEFFRNLPEGDQAEADALYAELDAEEVIERAVAPLQIDGKPVDLTVIKAPLTGKARANLSDSQFACPEKRKYPIPDKAHIRNALARCADPSNDQCGCSKVRAAARAAGIGGDSKDVQPDVVKATSQEVVTPVDGPEAPAKPEEEKTLIDRVDEGDPLGDAARALVSAKQADLSALIAVVTKTAADLVETKKALLDAQSTIRKLEEERDQAKSNVDLAKQFVEKLAELPIGRRASHAYVIDDFREKFSGVYDPEFIKMLTTGETNG